MNHPYITSQNAKSRQADLIQSAAAQRRIKALKAGKPTLWLTLRNMVRGWLAAPASREGVPGSLEAGKTA